MFENIKNICCIGAGYVGGPTMAVLADKCPNIEVNVIDTSEQRINQWNSPDLSNLPVYEPGLDVIIEKCRNKNLHFSTDIKKHIANADMIFISVNTPTKNKGFGAGQASDLKWIDASARQIGKYSKGNTIIVEKSTLPVKTAQTIKEILKSASDEISSNDCEEKKFYILSNPEFLAEGSAIKDLEEPDRVLIGGDNKNAINALVQIYSNWVNKNKILTTDLWSSELSKLIANALLAQRISAINSVSALCEETGAHVKDVSLAVGLDKRIGRYFLDAGPGFGGSCFKKDISNLVYICDHYGLNEVSSFWQKVIDINVWQKERISKIIVEKMFGTISAKKISILGFSFKANTNDTRESPAITICQNLIEEGAFLSIYDPRVKPNQIKNELGIDEFISNESTHSKESAWSFANSIINSVSNSDAIVLVTEWNEFKSLDWKQISKLVRKPTWLFDTRGIVDVEDVKSAGLNVWSIGDG